MHCEKRDLSRAFFRELSRGNCCQTLSRIVPGQLSHAFAELSNILGLTYQQVVESSTDMASAQESQNSKSTREVGLLQLQNARCPMFMAKFDGNGPNSCFQKTQHITSHRARGHGPRALAFHPVVQHEVSPKETARLAKACRPFFGCVPRAGLTSFRRKRNKQFGTVFLLVKSSEFLEPKHGFTTPRSHLSYPNHIRKSLRHLFFHSQLLFLLRNSVKPQKVWCMCSFGTTLPGKSSGKNKEHMLGSK